MKSRLHGGWKGLAFNTFFVGAFNALPRGLVERYGWHLLAFCRKSSDMIAFTKAHAYGNDFLYVTPPPIWRPPIRRRGRGGSAIAIAASAPTG